MKITSQSINFNGFLRFRQNEKDLAKSESTLTNPLTGGQMNEIVINTNSIDSMLFETAASELPNHNDVYVLTNAGERFVFRNITSGDFFEKLNRAHQQNTVEMITLNKYNLENYKD